MAVCKVGILGCGNISSTYVSDIQRFYKDLVLHVTEAMEALVASANIGIFYRMTTTCSRPEPIAPGGSPEEL